MGNCLRKQNQTPTPQDTGAVSEYHRTSSGEKVWIKISEDETDMAPNAAGSPNRPTTSVPEDSVKSEDFMVQDHSLIQGDSSVEVQNSPVRPRPNPMRESISVTRVLSEITDDDRLKGTIRQVKISRSNIDIDEPEIGSGNSGKVYKGRLLANGEIVMNIAVKTMTGTANVSPEMKQSFLFEASTMIQFRHPNVMELIGVCFDEAWGPMAVLPFMEKGDLRSYIRDPKQVHNMRNLMEYGMQIAKGMAYLSERKIIHRDLAARNCMVDEDDTINVADFGLTKTLHTKDFYHMKNANIAMPLKWMAIECLTDFVFSTKSDVWSFGVLLWELVTLGDVPYSQLKPLEILDMLQNGKRLQKPENCPEFVYDIMRSCWQKNPDDRPTFKDLVETLASTVEAADQTVDLSVRADIKDTYNEFIDAQEYFRPLSRAESKKPSTSGATEDDQIGSTDGYLRPWVEDK